MLSSFANEKGFAFLKAFIQIMLNQFGDIPIDKFGVMNGFSGGQAWSRRGMLACF